jgi:hypothetical protein
MHTAASVAAFINWLLDYVNNSHRFCPVAPTPGFVSPFSCERFPALWETRPLVIMGHWPCAALLGCIDFL